MFGRGEGGFLAPDEVNSLASNENYCHSQVRLGLLPQMSVACAQDAG